jgi:hypothetical protein
MKKKGGIGWGIASLGLSSKEIFIVSGEVTIEAIGEEALRTSIPSSADVSFQREG